MGRMMGPRNPLPDPDVKVAEFMDDEPRGKRFEINVNNQPWYAKRYEVRFYRDGEYILWLRFAYTKQGAHNLIRKARKRLSRKVTSTLVEWERF